MWLSVDSAKVLSDAVHVHDAGDTDPPVQPEASSGTGSVSGPTASDGCTPLSSCGFLVSPGSPTRPLAPPPLVWMGRTQPLGQVQGGSAAGGARGGCSHREG